MHRLFLNPVAEMLYLTHHHLLDIAQRRFTCISSTLTHQLIDTSHHPENDNSLLRIIRQVLYTEFPPATITREHLIHKDGMDQTYFAVEPGLDWTLLIKSIQKRVFLLTTRLMLWETADNGNFVLNLNGMKWELKEHDQIHWFTRVMMKHFKSLMIIAPMTAMILSNFTLPYPSILYFFFFCRFEHKRLLRCSFIFAHDLGRITTRSTIDCSSHL